MRKKALVVWATLSLGAATGAAAAGAVAARGGGVVGGPHDMTRYGYVDPQLRVCAFCHTPHHSATTGNEYLPLWSRMENTTRFNVTYNSSTIKATALKQASADKAIGPTRLCMSCHDGTIAPDQHYGTSAGAQGLNGDSFPSIGKGAGVGSGAAGLTNDHPVGFVYPAVAIGPDTGSAPDRSMLNRALGDPGTDPWIRNANALYLDNPINIKVADRLYLGADGNAYMTCATCHDVHNKKNMYTTSASEPNYLLLAPQAGSKLCLSCHLK